MVGSAGRTPFVGHFRGARVFGGVRLAWAGRVAATGTVEEGWAAAEQARDALSALIGAGDVDTVLSTARQPRPAASRRSTPSAPACGARWPSPGSSASPESPVARACRS